MFLIIGYVIILAASLGTYALHGHLGALWVPAEYVAIFGLMIGGLVAGNGMKAIKATMGALPSIFKGSAYNKAFYTDLLSMMYELLTKVRKEGLMSIEGDIDNPDASPILSQYPNFLKDHHAVEFLTDYLRLNALEIESLMDAEIETHHQEAHIAPHVMSKVADGVPAFGIVVAVMGVVNVMGSVGQPPAVLGHMIGGALVGTFLGILLSYGFVAPIASQLEQKLDEGSKIYQCMKVVLLASINGYAPQVAVEFGRKTLFSSDRMTFKELEDEVKNRKK
jgi:chemotaxis protein MotA